MTRILRIFSSLTIGLGIVLVFAFPMRPVAADGAATVIVQVQDQDENPLGGSCHSFAGPISFGEICDNDGGDADDRVGLVKIADLAPGDWTITEVVVPDGYQMAGDPSLAVTVAPGVAVIVVFEHDVSEGLVGSTWPDVDAEVAPPDVPHQPIATIPPSRLFPPPRCGGVAATIVIATSASGRPVKVIGTSGDDVIVGTAGPDVIAGLGGHDRICSLDGADDIEAGAGNDWVEAGGGDDTLDGAAGVDHLDGGPGKRDQCDGGTTAGGPENDVAIACETIVAVP